MLSPRGLFPPYTHTTVCGQPDQRYLLETLCCRLQISQSLMPCPVATSCQPTQHVRGGGRVHGIARTKPMQRTSIQLVNMVEEEGGLNASHVSVQSISACCDTERKTHPSDARGKQKLVATIIRQSTTTITTTAAAATPVTRHRPDTHSVCHQSGYTSGSSARGIAQWRRRLARYRHATMTARIPEVDSCYGC